VNFLHLALLFLIVLAAKQTPPQKIVVYASLDQIFSPPILNAFEKKTDVKVLDVYDSEVAKTTAIVNRPIAEKSSPGLMFSGSLRLAEQIVHKKRDKYE